jgi:hypothetical protein
LQNAILRLKPYLAGQVDGKGRINPTVELENFVGNVLAGGYVVNVPLMVEVVNGFVEVQIFGTVFVGQVDSEVFDANLWEGGGGGRGEVSKACQCRKRLLWGPADTNIYIYIYIYTYTQGARFPPSRNKPDPNIRPILASWAGPLAPVPQLSPALTGSCKTLTRLFPIAMVAASSVSLSPDPLTVVSTPFTTTDLSPTLEEVIVACLISGAASAATAELQFPI